MPRDPNRRNQEEDSFTVYVTGRGETLAVRQADAMTAAKLSLERLGYDKFALNLTIGDEEKMREHRWKEEIFEDTKGSD
jgi:hypothetical protein